MNTKPVILALLALAATTANAADLIGGTIQNRATKENLGLVCKDADAKNCKNFQFVLLSPEKDGSLLVRSELGQTINYDSLRNAVNADSVVRDMVNYDSIEIPELVGGINSGIYNGLEDTTLSETLWDEASEAYWTSHSIGGRIWRVALAVTLTPVAVAGDAGVYGGAAVGDAVMFTGDAAYVGVHNLIARIREAHIRNKIRKALAEISQPINEGKTIKITAKLFNEIVNRI